MILRCSLVLAFLLAAGPAGASVPSLRDAGINPHEVAAILGEAQMMILHDSRDFRWEAKGKKVVKKVNFVSSMKVVNASAETVRAVVRDVGKYPEFISEIQKVEELPANSEVPGRLASFETELNLMVMSLSVDYTLAYTDEDNGDVTWRLVSGDMDQHAGRWEFYELPNGKTLLAFTHWQDMESLGFSARMVFRAQPDLRQVIPVAWAAVVMNSLDRRAQGLPPEETPPKRVQTAPTIPMFSAGNTGSTLSSLRRFAEAGTLLFIHPKQWFRGKDGKPTDFSFMGAAAISDLPPAKLKNLATNFPRFPEFLDQVDSIKRAPDGSDGTRRFDFKLKVGISIFTIPVTYQLAYTDVTPLSISLQRVSGDLEYVYGAWEFFDVGEGKSMVLYTIGNKMGDDVPTLLKLGKNMANRDIIVGISATALTMQKLMPWLEKQ